MINIQTATRSYEQWVGSHISIVKPDLTYKHQRMAASPFEFLRATFYRWLQLWTEICPELSLTPEVLAVGDLHVENFGTWRDAEGRLIWGVNDFDESYRMPYTIDLVRLSTSAHLAIKSGHLEIRKREACDSILDGYRDGVKAGGTPFVLGENHVWLRKLALNELRDPVVFWKKMDSMADHTEKLPLDAWRALEDQLPAPGLEYRVKRRIAGLGSLGRQRLVALANWRGSRIAREAKSALPSACVWAGMQTLRAATAAAGNGGANGGRAAGPPIFYTEIVQTSVRVPDPFVAVDSKWIVRRLAPDCSRIELTSLPRRKEESKLLYAMGWETANIHLGTPGAAKKILRDLERRPARLVHSAAKQMTKAILRDWKEWKQR